MSDAPNMPDDSASQPLMVLPAAVAATRAARLDARGRLRQELIDSRAALRQEREAAAVAALTRSRRWTPRGARPPEVEAPPPAAEPFLPAAAPPPPEAPPPEPMATEPPATPPPEPALRPEATTGSVFATIMGGLGRAAAPPPEPLPEPGPQPLAEPVAEAAPPPPAPPPQAANEPTGTVTALGPGMLARLRLLGYAQLSDLAEAEPAELRRALGDISRLLNVEAWIAEARRQAGDDTAG